MTSSRSETKTRKNTGFVVALLLISTVAAASLWFGLVSPDPLAVDTWWNTQIIATAGTWPHEFALGLHVLGATPGTAGLTTAIVLVLLILRRVRPAVVMALTMLSVIAVSSLIKQLVQRPRPENLLVDQHGWSFPSGHSLGAATLAATVIAIAMIYFNTSNTVTAMLILLGSAYTLAMMWSRTALHVHWLSDTFAGAALGISLALIGARFLSPPSSARVGGRP